MILLGATRLAILHLTLSTIRREILQTVALTQNLFVWFLVTVHKFAILALTAITLLPASTGEVFARGLYRWIVTKHEQTWQTREQHSMHDFIVTEFTNT